MICGLIYSQKVRKRVRATLNSPFVSLLFFIRKDTNTKFPRFKIITGFRGSNLLIRANDKYIYKYSVRKCDIAKDIEVREFDITSELSKVSPIFIPVPTLLNFNNEILRRYDVVHGMSLRELIKNKKVYDKYKKYLAQQVAFFLYTIAKYDPKSLKKYKAKANDKPGFFYGWHHCDILDNFMMDKKTFKITSFIDWEETAFGDFSNIFVDADPVLNDFMKNIKEEYIKIYKSHSKKN
jgi:hypothetical protein